MDIRLNPGKLPTRVKYWEFHNVQSHVTPLLQLSCEHGHEPWGCSSPLLPRYASNTTEFEPHRNAHIMPFKGLSLCPSQVKMLFNDAPLPLNWLKCLGEQPVQQSGPLRASLRGEQRSNEILHWSTQAAASFPPKGKDAPQAIDNYSSTILPPCYLILKIPTVSGKWLSDGIGRTHWQDPLPWRGYRLASVLACVAGFC